MEEMDHGREDIAKTTHCEAQAQWSTHTTFITSEDEDRVLYLPATTKKKKIGFFNN
jgi:hypothetical protein